jgi:hypothetical protein
MFVGREKELLAKALTNPHDFFTCNPSWPMCRFNFTRPHSYVEEFVFKSENLSSIEIF